jgi:hypothetical protein
MIFSVFTERIEAAVMRYPVRQDWVIIRGHVRPLG